MLYLGLPAADVTLRLLSRGPASQQSRNLASCELSGKLSIWSGTLMSPNLRLSRCAACASRSAVRQFSIVAEAALNPSSPYDRYPLPLTAVLPCATPVPSSDAFCNGGR